MFQFGCCVKAALLLCLAYQIVQCQGYPFQTQLSPLAAHCEQSEQFLLSLQRMPATTAFQILTFPLTTGQFPLQIRQFREHLLYYIRSGNLRIDFLIRDLAKLRYLNQYDLMIALLFRIQSTYPSISNEVSKLVTHLLLKKYFGIITNNSGTDTTIKQEARYPYVRAPSHYGGKFENNGYESSGSITGSESLEFTNGFGSSIIGEKLIGSDINNFGDSSQINRRSPSIWPMKSNEFEDVFNYGRPSSAGGNSIIVRPYERYRPSPNFMPIGAGGSYFGSFHSENGRSGSGHGLIGDSGSFIDGSGSGSSIIGGSSNSGRSGSLIVEGNSESFLNRGSGSLTVGSNSGSSYNSHDFTSGRGSGLVSGYSSSSTDVGSLTNSGDSEYGQFGGRATSSFTNGNSDSLMVGGDSSSIINEDVFNSFSTGRGFNSLVGAIGSDSLRVGSGSASLINRGVSSHECKCQSNLIKFLIEKILVLERSRKQLQVSKITFDLVIPQILSLIPKPKYPYEIEVFNIFKSFLTSWKAQSLFSGVDFSLFQDRYQILEFVIQRCLSSTINEKIKEAFFFYSYFKESQQLNFFVANLIQLVPKPTNSGELQNYQIMMRFLRSREIYSYLSGLEINSSSSLEEIYSLILEKLLRSTLRSSYVKEVVSFYYSQTQIKKFKIDIEQIVALLPQPTNEEDVVYYHQFKELLTQREVYNIIQSLRQTTEVKDNNQFLLVLLQTLFDSNSVEIRNTSKHIWYNIIMKNFGINIIDLLSKLKSMVSTQQEILMYQIIENYFYSGEFINILTNISQETLSNYHSLRQLLQYILTVSTNSQMQTAVNFFINILERNATMDQMSRLIPLLPAPTTEEEKVNFDVVKNFLHSNDAYVYIKDIDTSLFNDDKFLLELILKRIAESKVQLPILNAFKYYSDFTEKLASIDLITKKEIKKRFKLTEIFTDTLELSSLSVVEKDAFRRFFKYISENKTSDSFADFTSWDQAKTRGQFMKLLFQYFLKSAMVPVEIKSCIAVLEPLVRMDGRGALPP